MNIRQFLILGILILFLSVNLFGQKNAFDNSFYQTYTDNLQWVKAVKAQGKKAQLELILKRFFKSTKSFPEPENELVALPILVIEGYPITEKSLNDKLLKDQLIDLLNIESVESITIIDKEENIYAERIFTGYILIKLDKRKHRKRFLSIKKE